MLYFLSAAVNAQSSEQPLSDQQSPDSDVVTKSTEQESGQDEVIRPPGWPIEPLAYIDRNKLDSGWYSYRVSAMDMYGRHSDLSDAMPWKQWIPEPKLRPWYYSDDVGNGIVDIPDVKEAPQYAINLVDKVAPPAPYAVQSQFIDTEDPTLHRDKDEDAIDWY